MYDPDNEVFFPDLMRAHRELGAAVETAYGIEFDGDDERCLPWHSILTQCSPL